VRRGPRLSGGRAAGSFGGVRVVSRNACGFFESYHCRKVNLINNKLSFFENYLRFLPHNKLAVNFDRLACYKKQNEGLLTKKTNIDQ
jgi:hypothetical protein